MKVIVASTNPVKIETARLGFKEMFEEGSHSGAGIESSVEMERFEFEGVSAQSEVSDQPMSDQETFTGAMNRVKNARLQMPNADFWVGIEGGIEDNDGEMHAFAWVVIQEKFGRIGKGKTGQFILPQKVAELIRGGLELGDADDKVFGKTNSKQANGSIGIPTHNVLTRTTFYQTAVILALIAFKNPDLYPINN